MVHQRVHAIIVIRDMDRCWGPAVRGLALVADAIPCCYWTKSPSVIIRVV